MMTKGSVLAPLIIGGATGIAGAGLTVWSGASWLLALLAYSLCGSAGVLAGGLLNYRLSEACRTSTEFASPPSVRRAPS